jgi:hypothetical protein
MILSAAPDDFPTLIGDRSANQTACATVATASYFIQPVHSNGTHCSGRVLFVVIAWPRAYLRLFQSVFENVLRNRQTERNSPDIS